MSVVKRDLLAEHAQNDLQEGDGEAGQRPDGSEPLCGPHHVHEYAHQDANHLVDQYNSDCLTTKNI